MRRSVHVFSRSQAEACLPDPQGICISITNPRQSPAKIDGWPLVMRLGFHDTDVPNRGFQAMEYAQAVSVLQLARAYPQRPLMVHCEAGASRSVAVGLFLAAWLRRPLILGATDVLVPNPWVMRQLRLAALAQAIRWRDWALLKLAIKGPMAYRNDVLPVPGTNSYRSV